MDSVPIPSESSLPPEKSGGMRSYVTYRSKDAGSNQQVPNKDERLWCFEPIGFTYSDTDSFFQEIAEWFCFDETDDLLLMETTFYESLPGTDDLWRNWSIAKQNQHIRLLIEQLDLSSEARRLNVYRCLAYISMGCYGECINDDEVKAAMFANSTMLLKNGALATLVEALHREMGRFPEHIEVASNVLSSPAVANLVIRPIDTLPLRLVMTPLYVMIESLRCMKDESLIQDLRVELNETFPHIRELLPVTLFDMLTRFCNGDAPHYPIRKVVLLLWKTLLSALGDLREAHIVKNSQRKAYNLPVVDEFTADVCNQMRPCTPPPNDTGAGAFVNLNTMGEGGESEAKPIRGKTSESIKTNGQRSVRPPHYWRPKVGRAELEKFINERRMKFVRFSAPGDIDSMIGLPRPIHEAVRVLKQHLYSSLAEIQLKEEEQIAKVPLTFHGVESHIEDLPAERLFAALLPSLPQYCIAILKLMLAAEPPPPSNANNGNANAAGGGQSRTGSGTLSVLTDCVQLAMTGQTAASVAASLRNGVEINRHRETILKALAATLLLLLKHFKAVHILHFELISQHLVFANALPLLVRLLSHNLCGLAASNNSMPAFEFPANVLTFENRQVRGRDFIPMIDKQTEQPTELPFNWRIVHTAINLLRILNKLVKGKQHRIALLHSLRCAGLLKRTIRLKQAMAQFYALKLLKLQSRFLGRQWRRSNMHSVSAIYERVRHRMTDDWAYGAMESSASGPEYTSGRVAGNSNAGGAAAGNNASAVGPACPEFQAAESQLRSLIDKFHARKYHSYSPLSEITCVIDCGSPAGKTDGAMSLLMPSNSGQRGTNGSPSQQLAIENRHCCTEVLKCHCTVWSASAAINITSDLAAVQADFFAGILASPVSPEEWIKREIFENRIDWDRLLQDSC